MGRPAFAEVLEGWTIRGKRLNSPRGARNTCCSSRYYKSVYRPPGRSFVILANAGIQGRSRSVKTIAFSRHRVGAEYFSLNRRGSASAVLPSGDRGCESLIYRDLSHIVRSDALRRMVFLALPGCGPKRNALTGALIARPWRPTFWL